MKKTTSDWILLFVVVTTAICLLYIWHQPESLLDSIHLFYSLAGERETGGVSNVVAALLETGAEAGWSSTLNIAPFILAYHVMGAVGLFIIVALSTTGTLMLVYLIAEEYSDRGTALFTAFVFAIFPTSIFFPQEVLFLSSTTFTSLLALYAMIKAKRQISKEHRYFFWTLCGISCFAYMQLIPWGGWLPIFILSTIYWRKLSYSQIKVLGFAALLIMLFFGVERGATSDYSIYTQSNPLREFLLSPNAIQRGYSELIPSDFSFSLPGNNPAIVIALMAIPILYRENRRGFRFVSLWFAVLLGCFFAFANPSSQYIFIPLAFPTAFLIALFFKPLHPHKKLLLFIAPVIIAFSIMASMEPLTLEVAITHEFPGWSTKYPLRDIGQIMGGLLLATTFFYAGIKRSLNARTHSILLNTIFLTFCLSQAGLLILLR